ncbi:MAG: FAD:protein FMN transferase [Deltaproteobacteria bacterium]|nr:MAG: FAD:protein FMN transferase [Deltaproteobacteria bacterium]
MLRPRSLLISSVLLLLLAGGCQQAKTPDTLRLSGQTMGTTWSVIMVRGAESVDSEGLQKRLQASLDQINRLMSTYDPESQLSRFNTRFSTDWFPISEETAQVIEVAQEVSRLSDGAFDVSIGPLVELWGFGPTPRGEKIPTEEQINKKLALVGYENIRLRRNPPAVRKEVAGLQIDLSAVAKGYAVDALAEIIEQQGINNYLLEIGGELQISGHRGDGTPWQIAIEKPLEGVREVAAIIPLTDTALATSGNYRNFYVEGGQRYSHTIDPVRGQPTRHKLAAVTVLDQTCARADALATALMALGEEKGRELCEKHQIAAYFIIHERTSTTVYASPAFERFLQEVKQ